MSTLTKLRITYRTRLDIRARAELIKQQTQQRLAMKSASKLNTTPAELMPTVISPKPRLTPDLALGIITSVRPGPATLPTSLRSIRHAGFTQHIHIFAQMTKNISYTLNDTNNSIHYDKYSKGMRRNWVNAAEYLLANTTSDWIMIMEDDIEWCNDGATIMYYTLNQIAVVGNPWRPIQIGVLSPYTSSAHVPDNWSHNPGWVEAKIPERWPGLIGSLALCFPRVSLIKLLQNPEFINFTGLHQVDASVAVVFKFNEQPPLDIKMHVPSLIAHRGSISTIPETNLRRNDTHLQRLRQGYRYTPDIKWRKTKIYEASTGQKIDKFQQADGTPAGNRTCHPITLENDRVRADSIQKAAESACAISSNTSAVSKI